MKNLRILPLIRAAAAFILILGSAAQAQKSVAGIVVPKYDRAAEATFKGTVEEVRNRQCPVSGGMGSHLILKLADGNTIEVHLVLAKFVKT